MSPQRATTPRERARRDAILPSNLDAARRGDERALMTLYALRAEPAAVCAALGLPRHEVGPTIVQAFREAWHTLPRCGATQAVEFDVWFLGILSAGVVARCGESDLAGEPATSAWGLPAALRNVLFLREVFGHGLGDIARALDEPESTIRLWYRNALEAIAA